MTPSLASARARGGEPADADLVAAVRAGDDRAFERLYGRYHRRIAAYIRGMVDDHGRAEDIAQEVFLSALRRMRATEQPIAFRPWVYEIAKNACIDQFRRARRTEEVSFDAEAGLAGDHGRLAAAGPSPDVAVDQKMSLDTLCGAFGGLSDVHHQIIVMRELEGLSYREMGERLGMSRPSVESTLFRARRRLSEEYEELISGERCRRVQAIIAGAASAPPGARDGRRLAAHLSHCQACRRHAWSAGVRVPVRVARARIAALLPWPVFLRRRAHGVEPPAPGSGRIGALAHWSAQLGAAADPGWIKAATAAAVIAVAGVGAGGGVAELAERSAPSAARPGHQRLAPPAARSAGRASPAPVTATATARPRAARRLPARAPARRSARAPSVGTSTVAPPVARGGGRRVALPGAPSLAVSPRPSVVAIVPVLPRVPAGGSGRAPGLIPPPLTVPAGLPGSSLLTHLPPPPPGGIVGGP